MKQWKWVSLGEIAEKIGSGLTPRGGDSTYQRAGVPFIRSQNIHLNRFEKAGLAYISNEQDAEMIDSRVLPGDVLLNITGASIGRVCTAPTELCPANVNQHVCIIRTNGKINPRFLAFFLATPDFQSFIANSQSGATRQALTKGQIEEFSVPQPEEEIQKRVAAILERADRLRRLRQYGLEMAEKILPAAFLELFGDLRVNPSSFQVRNLGDICDVRDGTHESPKFQRQGIPLVTSKNLVNGFVDLANVDLISEEDFANINKRSKVDRGDILMPMIGTIGNPVLVQDDAHFAIKNVALIKFVAGSPSAVYIRELLRGAYFDLLTAKNSRGGTQQFIALADIRGFPIPIAPLPMQTKFASVVARQEQLWAVHRESLRQAEHLFQTLLHRAFTSGL